MLINSKINIYDAYGNMKPEYNIDKDVVYIPTFTNKK